MKKSRNLLDYLPQTGMEEVFETLIYSSQVRIERIISRGQATPAGQWYDQENHEWVMVVKGKACIIYKDGERLEMGPGDYINIPAHVKHRVEWTDPNTETVWLAVHYS